MAEEEKLEMARQNEAEGNSPSTEAGEFVREEIHHVREGKHGARSAKQAIAIGLSKARRAGVKLPQADASRTSYHTRKKAKQDTERGRHPRKPSARRSRATIKALKREGHQSTSSAALSRHAKSSAAKRTQRERSAAGKKRLEREPGSTDSTIDPADSYILPNVRGRAVAGRTGTGAEEPNLSTTSGLRRVCVSKPTEDSDR